MSPTAPSTTGTGPALCDRTAPPRRSGARRAARTALVVGVAVVLLVVSLTLETLRVTGVSMQPTLHEGDVIVLDTWSARSAAWHRGDVVALQRDLSGRPVLLVKRVVAVAGDEVGIADGVLVVNDEAVDEPYADPDALDSVYFGPVVVPAGSVFLLGDNRRESFDSRDFGPVPASDVEGRVLGRPWSVPLW